MSQAAPVLVTVLVTVVGWLGCGRTPIGVSEPKDAGQDGAASPKDASVPDVPGAWQWVAPPLSNNYLLGVWGTGGDDVWAVGARGTVLHWNGTTYHWDGTTWSIVPVAAEGEFRDVWVGGTGEAWVVGTYGSVLHYPAAPR
jgi:photosystem II stability/assembly factor-like uncharacterized protein